jgi:mono/diheme cytochrome c family protein
MKAKSTIVALFAIGAIASGTAAFAEGGKVSIWSGVYTAAQAKRGETVHAGSCTSCHGTRLNGAGQPDMPPSPAIAREGFLRKWAGKPVSELFVYVRTKMPPDTAGSLTEREAIDSIAHMFAVSNIPAGDKEMPSDEKALTDFVIEAQPKK